MKAVIIDDENKARHLLSTILKEYCPQITKIEEAPNLMEGVKQIRKHQPDVVFLDIEMPDYLGIEICDFLEEEEMTFALIFTTAYSHYAVKAFEINAVDYLLKPMRPKQIKAALSKVEQRTSTENIHHQLLELKESVQQNTFKKIGIPVADGIMFLKLEDIICLEADGMYTKLYTTSSDMQMISKPLKYFVSLLDEMEFFYRPHRSFFINIHYVKQYLKKDGHSIVMDNDVQVPLPRDKREDFLELMNKVG